jgi:hypothetical protein
MRLFDPKKQRVKSVLSDSGIQNEKPAQEKKEQAPPSKPTDWPVLWRQLIEAMTAIANKAFTRQDAVNAKRSSEVEQATDALIKAVQESDKSRRPAIWTVEVLKTDRNGIATKLRMTPEMIKD